MNQLAVHKDDANVLLHQKNQLDEAILDKYRAAGQITDTGLKYAINLINEIYHYKTTDLKPISEICLIIDSVLLRLLGKVYTKCEKNISVPTSFNINQIVNNYSPEINDEQLTYFNEGDLITINLGVSIDGYCSNVSHTICIYPPGEKPVGPLLGPKADAMVANYYCHQVTMALLGLSMMPEKLPAELKPQTNNGKITGKLIKLVVNDIANYYNCRIIPGSEIRVIRRFLMGQNEFLQEKGYKGIQWDEEDQEVLILSKLQDQVMVKQEEDFTVEAGEVYQINLNLVSINDQQELGVISLEEINEFTGLNHQQSEGQLKARPTIYMRDFIMSYHLKLKHSRQLIHKIDGKYSVFPFKLNYLIDQFPLSNPTTPVTAEELEQLKQQLNNHKFGIQEIVNHNLINYKPIRLIKYVPMKTILQANCIHFKALENKEKAFKSGRDVTNKSSELTTVLINDSNDQQEIWKLSNNVPPVFCHLDFQLQHPVLDQLLNLVNGKFGIKVKTVNSQSLATGSQMELD